MNGAAHADGGRKKSAIAAETSAVVIRAAKPVSLLFAATKESCARNRRAVKHLFIILGTTWNPGSFRDSVRDPAGSNVRHAAITQILTDITALKAHHDRA